MRQYDVLLLQKMNRNHVPAGNRRRMWHNRGRAVSEMAGNLPKGCNKPVTFVYCKHKLTNNSISNLPQDGEQDDVLEHQRVRNSWPHMPHRHYSFEADNLEASRRCYGDNRSPITSGVVLPHSSQRRESFIYKSDLEAFVSPKLSRHSSIVSDCHNDELIVTPFAQILASLQNVKNNFIQLNKRSKTSSYLKNISKNQNLSNVDESLTKLSTEILNELEWCLYQLESVQTQKSVSDMTTIKFRRLLNKELNHLTHLNTSSSTCRLSEYINSTFFDTDLNLTMDSLIGEEINAAKELLSSVKEEKHISTVKDFTTISKISGIRNTVLGAERLEHDLIPKYGVELTNIASIDRLMRSLDDWGFDTFRLSELSDNRPLTTIFYTIFKKRDLLNMFKIQKHTLISYLTVLEDHYRRDVVYHNRDHAADVVQATHVLLNFAPLECVFTPLECMSALFAAAVHDVDHPGVTNQFLINTGSELAIMYNDESVLENHHLAVAFKLLQSTNCDIFENLSRKQRQSVRKMVIDMVLSTDMSKHMGLLANLKTTAESKKVSGSNFLLLDNYTDRIQVLQGLLHCADLSGPTKPLMQYQRWVGRIMEEFFKQGDIESEQQMEVSPLCDRHSASVELSQTAFIEFIVQPLWDTWADLIHPHAQPIIDSLDSNYKWYLSKGSLQQIGVGSSLKSSSGVNIHLDLTEQDNEDNG